MIANLYHDDAIQAVREQLQSNSNARVHYDDEAGTLVASIDYGAWTHEIRALRKGEPGQPWIVRTTDVVTTKGVGCEEHGDDRA